MSNIMKIGLCIFGGFFLLTMVATCNKSRSEDVSTEVIAQEYAKGLNLKLVAQLAKQAKNAEDFEQQLNSSSSKVNNIDLNDDGKVDYIKVTEYGNGSNRGFSLTSELEEGKEQEIATIQFSKQGDSVDMEVAGNPSLYGNGHHYRSSFGLSDVILLSWLFSDTGRSRYASPYGYSHYPSHFNRDWKRKTNKEYQGYAGPMTSSSSFRKSSVTKSSGLKSPNASKTAARASILANPTKSQKSFQARSGSSSTRSGGFGRSSSGFSSSSRSGSSFGGGK